MEIRTKYTSPIKACENSILQLYTLKDVFKDMTRALNRDDVLDQLKKRKDKSSTEYISKLSETWLKLVSSQGFLNNMLYVHSWTLFDNWLDDTFEQWLIAESDKIEPTIKITAKEILLTNSLNEVKVKLAKEELEGYTRNGVIAKIKKIEEKFKIKVFLDNRDEVWFKEAREIRNSIVHGKTIKSPLLYLKKLDIQLDKIDHDIIIRCIYRQIFVIRRILSELKKRESEYDKS